VEMVAVALDSFGVAGTPVVMGTLSVLDPAAITEDQIFKGELVKAAHINNLREAIALVHNAYLDDELVWESGWVEAGTTPTSGWKDHVEEMRAELDRVITAINTWDSQATDCLVEAPEWIPITGTQPRADVMEQLRTVIASI